MLSTMHRVQASRVVWQLQRGCQTRAPCSRLPKEEDIRNVEGYLSARDSLYRDTLETLVRASSYTRDANGVRRQAQLTSKTFAHLGLPLSCVVESVQDHHGPHLVLATQDVTLEGSSAPSGQQRGGSTPASRNNLANKTKSLPTVGLVSHLDTVYPEGDWKGVEWTDEIEDFDRVVGPGTMDIKGGTVVGLMVLDTLHSLYPDIWSRANIILVFNAAEEEMAEDFGSIARQWLGNPKDNLGCFVLEAGFVGAAEATVVTARKGRCVWTIEGMGVEGHSGNAHQTSRNAIVHLCDAVKSISDLTDYSKDVTVNVGVIHGGRGVNTVPGYSYAEVEMRAADTHIFESIAHQIETILDDLPHVQGSRILTVPVWPENRASQALAGRLGEVARCLGLQMSASTRGGGSDGNWLWSDYAVVDGLGPCGRHAHCGPNQLNGGILDTSRLEYADWSSFRIKAALLVHTIVSLVRQNL